MGIRRELQKEDAQLAESEHGRGAELSRAARARAIMDDPMVVAAFDAIEKAAFKTWASSPGADAAGRERVYDFYRAAQRFRAEFKTILETGVMAEKQLLDIRVKRERISRKLSMGTVPE